MNNKNPYGNDLEQFKQQLLAHFSAHWRLFLGEGIVFILLGIAAVIVPQVSSLVIIIFLGWVIVLGGFMHITRAVYFRDMPGFGLWLGLGVLQVMAGYLLIGHPVSGVVTLTMLMTLFFGVEGIIKISLALLMRPLPQWSYVLFSGFTALTFSGIVLAFWTETEHWLLGLFLGINMIMLGSSMVKMSLSYRAPDLSK